MNSLLRRSNDLPARSEHLQGWPAIVTPPEHQFGRLDTASNMLEVGVSWKGGREISQLVLFPTLISITDHLDGSSRLKV